MKVTLLGKFGNDEMVVDAARVSHSKLAENYSYDVNVRLINYLARNKHESPFFHPQVQFRISAPIFVARQWFRHQVGISRNEISRRYVDDNIQLFQPTTWRQRPEAKIKQGSGDPVDVRTQYKCEQMYRNALDNCQAAYDALLSWGVAPEQARMVLPQSMETEWIETMSLMAAARTCRLRLDEHTQVETREVAQQISDLMLEMFPISWDALMRNNARD